MSEVVKNEEKVDVQSGTVQRYKEGPILRPRADIFESDEKVKVELELPGVEKEDIDVSVKDGELNVLAKRRETEDDGFKVVYVEKRAAGFERQFSLGKNLDTEKVEAHYEDGVLTLSIAKKEEALPKQIAIQ